MLLYRRKKARETVFVRVKLVCCNDYVGLHFCNFTLVASHLQICISIDDSMKRFIYSAWDALFIHPVNLNFV